MTHSTALAIHAVDRYALGDMSEEEASAFEAHYFDCADCARDVRETVAFADNARVALDDPALVTPPSPSPDPETKHSIWDDLARPVVVLPLAATLLLGAFVLFQATVTIPELREHARPRALPQPTVLRVTRAELPVVHVIGPSFQLLIDITAPEPFPRYEVQLQTETGEPVISIESPSPPSEPLRLYLPAGLFPEGRYTATLNGLGEEGTRQMLETYSFRVVKDSS